MTTKGTSRAFDLLRRLPRISLATIKNNPGAYMREGWRRADKQRFFGQKGSWQRQNFPPAGFEGGSNPFYKRFPVQNFYQGHHVKLSYVPLTMRQLQLSIDLLRLRTDVPIDVTQLVRTGLYKINPMAKEGGFLLQDEGLEYFKSAINLEVQWTSEPVIAAIECNGGTITTAYYDPLSLVCGVDPAHYFSKGKPIPRRMFPPQHLLEYYSNPKNRGYLADPDEIAEDRLVLSQKYGYMLPDLNQSDKKELLLLRKDPRQLFYGLEPGWIVNLTDKCILKPKNPELMEYYAS